MNERPSNKWTLPIVAAALLLIGAWYWYSYRPSKISARCFAEAQLGEIGGDPHSRQENIEKYFKNCKRSFGLQ